MTDTTGSLTQGNAGTTPRKPAYLFYRHTIPVRVLHWLNALIMLVMLMSGLQIFNAHPALYWGNGADFDHPFVSLTAQGTQDNFHGVTQIGSWTFNTDGFLGASYDDGVKSVRGFPDWVTLPAASPNL